MDLSDLDAAAAERRAQREKEMATAPGATAGHHRHRRGRHSSRSGSRIGTSEFNRRVQLVLFVALLLVGVVVVFRACSGGPRRVEPEPLGQSGEIQGLLELRI